MEEKEDCLFDIVYDKMMENKSIRESGKLIALPWTDIPQLNTIIPGIEKERYTIVTASSKVGKCLGFGTKIIMFDGTLKEVQDIRVGDLLMGDDSTARTVLSLARGQETLYKIKQKNGDDYIVNESHILSLRHHDDYKKENTIIDISLVDYLKKSNRDKRNMFGWKPIIPLTFENTTKLDTNISPYLCGLWLADGRKNRLSFSVNNNDFEIRDFIENVVHHNNWKISETNIQKNSKDINIKMGQNIYLDYFRKLNIFNNKHIPQEWLTLSIEDRFSLLAGYLDGDGYVMKGNTPCYGVDTSNEYIISGIRYLCRSLGLSTSLKKRERLDSRTKKKHISYVLIIGGNIEKIPVLLKRKKVTKLRKYTHNISKIEVEKLEVGDYYGFTLDGNHRYLLGDFTVTHNTQLGDSLFVYQPLKYLWSHPNCGLDIKVFYFSLEVSKERKMQQAIVNKIYEDCGEIYSPQEIDSKFQNFILSDKLAEKIKSLSDYFNNFFLKKITFIDNIRNPFGIYSYMRNYAMNNGYYVNKEGKEISKELIYQHNKDAVISIDRYIPYNQKEIVVVVTDHISLLQQEKYEGQIMSKHETMSKFSHEYCLSMRDRWQYHVVNIQQQAMEQEKQQFTFKGESIIDKLRPSADGLGDCKLTGRDVNYMFGLFAPDRYKQITEYQGYDINKLRDNYRELSIILNREGSGFINIDLFFNGACTIFQSLPSPEKINYKLIEDIQKKLKNGTNI